MTIELDISPELRGRIAAIARRSGLSEAQVVTDALEMGHSLEWQETFLDKIASGMAAAEREDFATRDEIAQIRNRYRRS
jgi:predicted transcriptional regulator